MINFKSISFSKEEYNCRISKVQEVLKDKGLDALICHDAANICYLCGIQSVTYNKYFMLVIPALGEAVLLCQSFEAHNGTINTWMDNIHIYKYTDTYVEDPIEKSIDLILEMGLGSRRLGLEKNSPSLSVNHYLQLLKALPDAEIVDAAGLVETVRSIKSAAEIAYIRQASVIACQGIRDVLEGLEDGMTDNDLAAIAYRSMISGGSEYMSIDPIVTVGNRSGIPHTTFNRTPINQGDVILLEFGACLHRYTGVTMRTISKGQPNDQVKTMVEGCAKSVNTTIANMRPGAVCSDIAALARKSWEKETARWLWHGIYAYSIGLGFPPRWDDSPVFIREGNNTILQPGMVFHVTTSLRDIGIYGVSLSETVLITETGREVLTDLPRELYIR